MRASRGEIKIEEILQDAGLHFEEEYISPALRSDNGRPLRFDFVVFDDDGKIDFIIEY
jgi:DNA anti-recombination protein RmuC